MAEQTTTTTEICVALKLFADGALALAAALEQAQGIQTAVPELAPPPPEDDSPPVEVSFLSTKPLLGSSIHKRRQAAARAKEIGYCFKHWAAMVHKLRVDVIGTTAGDFGAMLGLSEGCVHNWEAGVAFASSDNRVRLESLGRGVAGWAHADWRGTLNGEVSA